MFGLNHARAHRAIPAHRRIVSKKRTPIIECLESRQMFSVSAATLAGPNGVSGVVWSYETLENGAVDQFSTQRVIGPATFATHKTVEIGITNRTPLDVVIGTTKSFDALTSAGLINYGSAGTQFIGTTSTQTQSSYSPPEVIFPATMTAGKTYTLSNTLNSLTTGQTGSSKSVIMLTRTLKLESAMKSVTVPAGKFKSYVIDVSIMTSATTTVTVIIAGHTIIKTTKSSNTVSGKEYCAPNVGFVESAIGGSVQELTTFSGKNPLSYSGKITGTLPKTTLTAGQKTKINESLILKNTGKTPIKGPAMIDYYLSNYPTVQAGDIPLGSTVTTTLNMTAGASNSFALNITTIPAPTPSGLYYIVAEVTDYQGSILDFATSSTLNIVHK
jgi:hypothetical protein